MSYKKLECFIIIFILIITLSHKNNMKDRAQEKKETCKNSNSVTLFLCGDVMTGRGIDQILSFPCNPVIYKPYMKDAREYIEIAESIEIYKNKPVIYGCGDFINDYEGIGGYEEFRDDLSFMYFQEIDINSKKCIKFILVPMQIKKFQVIRAAKNDVNWLLDMLNKEGKKFGTSADIKENIITLNWKK